MSTWIQFRDTDWDILHQHLFPIDNQDEQAAFIFLSRDSDTNSFFAHELWLIGRREFSFQSPFHIEIREEIWNRAIKNAHDHGWCFGEIHSHRSSDSFAQFSMSDVEGLRDNVPYVRWRLRKAPYVACVLSPTGFDGLHWSDSGDAPAQLSGIFTDEGTIIEASGLSIWRNFNGV